MVKIASLFMIIHFLYSQNIRLSLLSAGSIFMVWALNRELDPDNDTAALITAILYGSVLFFVPVNSSFLSLFWLLLAMRSLSLCVGLKILASDYFLLSIFSFFISYQNQQPALIIINTGLLLSLILIRKEKQAYPGLAASIVGLFYILLSQIPSETALLSFDRFAPGAGLIAALFLFFVFTGNAPKTMDDQGNQRLIHKNIISAQLFFVLYTISVMITSFPENQMVLLASAMTGSLLYQLYARLA